MKFLATLLLLATLSGCMLPLKPGSSTFVRPDGSKVTVHQSENPKTDTVQDYKRTTDAQGVVTEEVHTKIGAAQKDLAREMQAKLGSLRPVMWVGILVFLFGASSFVWPYTKVIVGSVTTSAVITAAGLLMIVLPTLIVGNEILILAGCGGAAAFYFFAIRHGHARGEARVLREMIDLNKNGIDDREEKQ